MKKSLQALISILSLCTIACHKNDSSNLKKYRFPSKFQMHVVKVLEEAAEV
jgi:hypothetical protein